MIPNPVSSSSHSHSMIMNENALWSEVGSDNANQDGYQIDTCDSFKRGINVWKKPLDPQNSTASVMGASSWPALPNSASLSSSSKEASENRDQSFNSFANKVAVHSTLAAPKATTDISNAAPCAAQGDICDASSGESITSSNASSEMINENGSLRSSPVAAITAGGGVSSVAQKNAVGTGPARSCSSRPRRQFDHHRSHQYNRYPQNKGRDCFSHGNGNHNINNRNRHMNKKQHYRFHDFNPGHGFGPRTHAYFHSQHGFPNKQQPFMAPMPPLPPHPYSFPFYNNPYASTPGFGFPGFGENIYIEENIWSFAPHAYMDMMGGDSLGNFCSPTADFLTQCYYHPPLANAQTQVPLTNHQSPLDHPSSFPPSTDLSTPISSAACQIRPNSLTYKSDSKEKICKMLRRQIEYYFSDENLAKDDYLKSQMDEQGWVSVYVILACRRVNGMTKDANLILEALQPSTCVEIQGFRLRKCNVKSAEVQSRKFGFEEHVSAGEVAAQLQNLDLSDCSDASSVSVLGCSQEISAN